MVYQVSHLQSGFRKSAHPSGLERRLLDFCVVKAEDARGKPTQGPFSFHISANRDVEGVSACERRRSSVNVVVVKIVEG